MAKFKAGDAVKLRDDVVYGQEYNQITLSEKLFKRTKYQIGSIQNATSPLGPDYNIFGTGIYVGEDALEAWPESTEETMSNEIDPQLFELVKAALTGLCANPNNMYKHEDAVIFNATTAIYTAKETLRLLREEKL